MRRTFLTVGIQLLLLGASAVLALTPEEADRAIQQGLEAQSIRGARDFYVIRKFSSREGAAQRLLMGTRRGYEYTLMIRSCRQLLQFAAFQSKTDDAIDLDSLRSSCIAQDRVWIAIDEGDRNVLTVGLLKKVIGPPKRQPAAVRVTRFEVVLDGEAVEPLGQIDLEELGPGSSAAVFSAGPFLEAERGEITVIMGETQQAVGELQSQLLRRLFGQQ